MLNPCSFHDCRGSLAHLCPKNDLYSSTLNSSLSSQTNTL